MKDKLVPEKPKAFHEMVKTDKFDEDAFINETMHDLIDKRDQLMTGVYHQKEVQNMGTDPMEIKRIDAEAQYTQDDFYPQMRKAFESGQKAAWPL